MRRSCCADEGIFLEGKLHLLLRALSDAALSALRQQLRDGQGAGDSGNNLHGNRGGAERREFFRGVAKEHGVSAYEVDNSASGAGVGDDQRVEFVLWNGYFASVFVETANFRRGRSFIENCGGNLIVMQNHVGGLNVAQGFDGEQIGIAWTRAHQSHTAQRSFRILRGREGVGQVAIDPIFFAARSFFRNGGGFAGMALDEVVQHQAAFDLSRRFARAVCMGMAILGSRRNRKNTHEDFPRRFYGDRAEQIVEKKAGNVYMERSVMGPVHRTKFFGFS